MKRLILSLLFAGALGLPMAGAAAETALPPGLVQSCEACHGKGGDSQRADVPRLNGQRRDYLVVRLHQFQDPTRGTPHANRMMWQNAQISDDQAAALADYFSSQPPMAAIASGAKPGASLFQQGLPPAIPACASCHGLAGEGQGGTPRLAGQHGEYLVSQLEAFLLTARVGEPMNHHTWSMTPDQIKSVSDYLSHN